MHFTHVEPLHPSTFAQRGQKNTNRRSKDELHGFYRLAIGMSCVDDPQFAAKGCGMRKTIGWLRGGLGNQPTSMKNVRMMVRTLACNFDRRYGDPKTSDTQQV